MNRTRLTMAVLVVLAAAMGWWAYALFSQRPALSPFIRGQTNSHPLVSANTSSETIRGQQLAQTYCQACHLLPDPALLDKASWEQGALPVMAPWLGFPRPELKPGPDDGILKQANIFPSSPIISQADWVAIGTYYRESAPTKPLPQGPRPEVHSGLKQFRIKNLPYHREVPMTTLVKIDPPSKRLFVGDAMTRTL